MSDLRMPSINQVTVSGRLCRDPKFGSLVSGKHVCEFSIANVRSIRGKDGPQEVTSYVPVKCFGGIAEWVQTSLKKGRPVLVTGTFNSETTLSMGKSRTAYGVWASKVEVLDYAPRDGAAAVDQEREAAALAGYQHDA